MIKRPAHLGNLQNLLHGHRYLLCVDLEATCDGWPAGFTDDQKAAHPLLVTKDEMEMIEFGGVVIDLLHDGKVVGEFSRFIRPALHPKLTEFCIGLTTISQADVDGAQGYAEVAEELEAFVKPFRAEGLLWCSWGDYDARQLQADANRAGIPAMLYGLVHTNMKKWHWKIFRCRAMGLRSAVEDLGLEWSGVYHRGIDDARNLARLCVKIAGGI